MRNLAGPIDPTTIKVFETYETGDPYSRAWDCTEYTNTQACNEGIGVYRGDISGKWSKRDLHTYLRKTYPGAIVRVRR